MEPYKRPIYKSFSSGFAAAVIITVLCSLAIALILCATSLAENTAKQPQRPHYHALLFNCSFSDLFQVGKDLYQSPLVNQLWTAGEHRIGTLTGASAYYVAGYTVKALGKTYCTPDGEILRSHSSAPH